MNEKNQRRLEQAVMPSGNRAPKRASADRDDYPLKPCDFSRWLKFDSMSLGQACFVLTGFEPPRLEALHFVPTLAASVGLRVPHHVE